MSNKIRKISPEDACEHTAKFHELFRCFMRDASLADINLAIKNANKAAEKLRDLQIDFGAGIMLTVGCMSNMVDIYEELYGEIVLDDEDQPHGVN